MTQGLETFMNAVGKVGSKIATAPNSEAAGIKAKTDNVKEYMNATGDESITPKATPPSVNPNKVDKSSQYGTRPGEHRFSDAEIKDMSRPLGSFKKGTNYVPKTGLALLHKGEAVIPAKENKMDSTYDMVKGMGKDKPPKKEIKEMVHTKSHNGKHVVTHRHHNPSHHPDEMHVMNDMAELHDHMENHAGSPNEGEAAPAGADGSAPAQMTAAPSPAPMAAPGA